jgi:DNA excision repair protein ERCC-2
MKFLIEDLMVYFPYEFIYPEQYQYMVYLKQALDGGDEGRQVCLEMPTGTGKTVSLLALITSYQVQHPQIGKLIYCCRTVGELSKTMEEVRGVLAYRDNELGISAPQTLAVALSSRKNLCIHPDVRNLNTMGEIDSACREMTAPWKRDWAKAKKADGQDVKNSLCDYYEGFDSDGGDLVLSGVYSLDDLKAFGEKHSMCPYFLARHAITTANILVYSYQYIINPRISDLISKQLQSNSILVFDEAHNIDDVCIDSLSINMDKKTLDHASSNLIKLQNQIKQLTEEDAERLKAEYNSLLKGLQASVGNADTDFELAKVDLPEDIIKEAVPEEIRNADEFLRQVRGFLEYLRGKLHVQNVVVLNPATFLQQVFDATKIEPKYLKFYSARLSKLLRTLQITQLHSFTAINMVCDFATFCSSHAKGFQIIIEPFDERTPNIPDPIFQFCCLDAAIAMKPILKKYKRIIITSGTLSPIDMLPRILQFHPVLSKSLTTTMFRQTVQPLVVSRGSDQTFLSTKFKDRDDMDILRNYGLLLLRLCEVIPDGIVAFFTSYYYMENIMSIWNTMGLVNQILKHKLLFVETPDIHDTSIALHNYKLACDCGRGAVFLSVSRGKVSEGIDFANHYGRCVVIFGIPYVYTESRKLKARLEFLNETYQIREGDFLTFDAMRTAAQCVGRVIRGKSDYGIMILADHRYNRIDKRDKLPPWILQYLTQGQLNLSTDAAVTMSSNFLREMSQPVSREEQIGVSLWTIEDVKKQPASKETK